MAIEDNWASPTGTRRPLEAVLDELDGNALDVMAYLMDLQGLNGRVDAAGAACIRQRLELLDELGDRLDDRSPFLPERPHVTGTGAGRNGAAYGRGFAVRQQSYTR